MCVGKSTKTIIFEDLFSIELIFGNKSPIIGEQQETILSKCLQAVFAVSRNAVEI